MTGPLQNNPHTVPAFHDSQPLPRERTQSVQNGIPTRSMGTMVILRTPLVPHATVGMYLRDALRHKSAPPCNLQDLKQRKWPQRFSSHNHHQSFTAMTRHLPSLQLRQSAWTNQSTSHTCRLAHGDSYDPDRPHS
ncbi:hypothetical protein E2N90_24320 [Pseudomonas syringae pv. tomato]|nr:hypothetical protein [Pseudomonas syringae pv. tomato]PYD05846.1 hypothetical protein DND90_20920 [Pseudomonas syringae pv. maculicola]QBI61843.1 hypothetical protein EIZ61_10315 [Pseudomonas syringae]TES64198.1 hypothetical protein E2N90_24320 [Pseudomonas syringae pv. tomato]